LLATYWCIGLVIALVAYLIWLARQSDYGAWETVLYIPTYLMGRLLWRVHFLNEPPPEIATGGILVANHRSSVDPFFVQLAARRRVHWMVAKEYCQHVIFGKILRPFEVIPTNRSGVDTASTKQAIRLAKAGRLVGMFPEGQLNKTPNPLCPIRSGAALVATRGNVPLIPLYIKGSPYDRTVWSPVFMSANVAITFGTAIHPKDANEFSPGESACEDPKVIEADGKPGRHQNSAGDLQQSEQLIIAWAKQVVAMAGRPDFPVKLATKRTRRKTR